VFDKVININLFQDMENSRNSQQDKSKIFSVVERRQ